MLSYVCRIASEFERRHGVVPNLLYLNHQHFEQLKLALDGLRTTRQMFEHLNMQVVIQRDVVHPRVARSATGGRAG
jgi:hypothetical protein